MNNIDTTIEKLKTSPLFYLFLSSRELFHSNFWFWLSTINKTETIKLFTDKNIGNNLIFEREHNQSSGEFKSTVDLVISSENSQKIAIENKVKDFPTIGQLERIKNSFGTTTAELILTTLFWTNELEFNGWTVKTYRQISEAIKPKNFTDNSYYQDLISDYKEFTSTLASLTEQLNITQEYDFAISLNKELYNKLNDIKLWESYQKLRASHLLFCFNKSNIHNVTTAYGINNQKVTIDFVLPITSEYKIGIQIEDNHYRKFIIGPKHVQFSENLRSNNIFFNNVWMSPQKKTMMSYKPNFKYQYEKIGKIKSDDLFKKINDDILAINNDIENIRKHIPSH
jgi:hypothetical protein